MTEHTVTVEKRVEEEETVYTCDYCGLGDDAAEMAHYTFDSSDSQGLHALNEQLNNDSETIPDLHFHVSCLPDVVADDGQADAITLASQYKRRTGDSLLLVITKMSLVFYIPALGAILWGHLNSGVLSLIALVVGVLIFAITLLLSWGEAKKTLKEFST